MKILGTFPKTRMRRVRKSDWIRRLISENHLSVNDLILPIFIREGRNKKEEIKTMPGVYRYSVDKVSKIIDLASKSGIPMVALFPYTPKDKKNSSGSEALNPNNLICQTLRKIKKRNRNIGVMCDVALDPYTNHGHDGVLKNNYVDNDKTVKILQEQALLQAQNGCDVIAPSDMMDGRVSAIRNILEKNKYYNTKILSYAVKYASNFYGPFRDAVGSKKILIGDKKTYQMDFHNSAEALREVGLDIKEGADLIMVKPGMPYLDIIKSIKDNFKIPVLSYQVSGEYSLIKYGIKKKVINENAILESLICLKRAGSNAVVSYFSQYIANKINNFK